MKRKPKDKIGPDCFHCPYCYVMGGVHFPPTHVCWYGNRKVEISWAKHVKDIGCPEAKSDADKIEVSEGSKLGNGHRMPGRPK